MIRIIKYLAFQLLFVFLVNCGHIYSQKSDTTAKVNNFRTVITITNNGISLIPTFSLGKPAIIFDASIGRRLTFDPLIRYSLEGKPWSFIFWWRYKLLKPGRFQFTVGAHPAVLFKTVNGTVNGVSTEITRARQYAVAELFPNYMLTKQISVGMYYNYSRGITEDDNSNTNFLTARIGLANIKLFNDLSVTLVPQVYYLKIDKLDGFYATSAVTFLMKNVPFTLSSVINKTIKSEIVSDDFVWNVSLNYIINKQYIRRLP